ncbi:conserved hypothetical protein, partial [Trichinella spiralis]|uniref:hypothetical protein n=1 Tax=Trichinella spiralis TaxID=6334 RepID=UPI0001EFE059
AGHGGGPDLRWPSQSGHQDLVVRRQQRQARRHAGETSQQICTGAAVHHHRMFGADEIGKALLKVRHFAVHGRLEPKQRVQRVQHLINTVRWNAQWIPVAAVCVVRLLLCIQRSVHQMD